MTDLTDKGGRRMMRLICFVVGHRWPEPAVISGNLPAVGFWRYSCYRCGHNEMRPMRYIGDK